MPGKGKERKKALKREGDSSKNRYAEKKAGKKANRQMMKEKANNKTQLHNWGLKDDK